MVTVPAYFNAAQKKATEDAAKIAGLEILRIINEPTAAALAAGFHESEDAVKNILVFDFGGGTLDVTILKIESGRFITLATSGDCHLGGQDVDNALVEHFFEKIQEDED